MIIRVEQRQLNHAVNIVQRAVSSKSTMPILKCILLIAKADGLILVGNDMQIGIESKIETQVLEGGSIALDSKLFGDIVRNIHDEFIQISTDENLMVNIKSNNLEVNLKGFSDMDFPKLPEINQDNLISVTENILLNMISQTVFAVADTDYMQIINGQMIEVKDNRLTMAATDTFRFALREQYYANPFGLNTRIVVPGNSLKEIRRLLDAESASSIKIALEENHALFILGHTKIVTRLLQGDFIKYDALIPRKYETELKIRKKDIIEALQITSVFAEKANSAVALRITDNNLEVFSSSEMGHISKNVPVQQTGANLEIAFNIRYLMEGLKAIGEDDLMLSFASGSRAPAVIRSLARERYEYLISPVLMSGIN